MATDFNAALGEAAAAKIYDHPTSKHEAREEVKPAPTEHEKLAAQVYSDPQKLPDMPVPENIKALRASAKSWLPAEKSIDLVDEEIIGDGPTLGVTPERSPAEKSVAREFRLIAADIGLSSPEAREIADLGRQLAKNPPSEKQIKEWAGQIHKRLMDQNDQKESAAAYDLDLARQLVRRDPRLQKFLNDTGLGNHPRLVEILRERAFAERVAGRLPDEPVAAVSLRSKK